jgi:hypothetical protein
MEHAGGVSGLGFTVIKDRLPGPRRPEGGRARVRTFFARCRSLPRTTLTGGRFLAAAVQKPTSTIPAESATRSKTQATISPALPAGGLVVVTGDGEG